VSDEPNSLEKDNEVEAKLQRSIASIHQLSSLESETLLAEIHLLGQLRDRLSPAARFAAKIQTKYHRKNQKTETESEHAEYLVEGFPFAQRGNPLTGLLVIDQYSTVPQGTAGSETKSGGQYLGERLYLTHDRKWILAERFGFYSETSGSSSEWEATCRIVTDRSLLERYSIDAITDGLFEATNQLWENLSPRLEALKKRSQKAHLISSELAQMKSLPKLRFDAEPTATPPQPPAPESTTTTSAVKVRRISRY
jgi:hypothetical protein